MRCLNPINIKVKEARNSNDTYKVPCGRCYACLSNRRNEWTYRLIEENKYAISSYFITLTYDNINNDGNVYKETAQKFIKRLRHHYKKPLKYYLISEYGDKTYRPHYHALIFFYDVVDDRKIQELLIDSWKYGNYYIGKTEHGSIHYCAKYHITKGQAPDGLNKPFCLMSRKPAIGYSFINTNANRSVENAYVYFDGGNKAVMPRYYRKKIYTEEQQREIGRLNVNRHQGEPIQGDEYLPYKQWKKDHPNKKFSDYNRYILQWKEQQQQKSFKIKTKL